jgi:GT2 family glycosyltransferase
MTAQAPEVSVLIAVLDEVELIETTAAMIAGQDFAGRVEYLFLDGGSTDGTREQLVRLAEADPRVRLIDNPGRTQVKALNAGLRAARGEIIVQMDAHTFYPVGFLRVGVERLRRGDVGWVAGPPVPVGRDAGSRRVAAALRSRFGTGGSDKWHVGSAGAEVELDTGVFGGFWTRETLERLGGWNEDWPVNHDAELAARHIAMGGRIVCVPGLASEYVPRSTLRGLWRQYRLYGFYRAATSRLHPHSTRPSHMLSLAPALAIAGSVGPSRSLRRIARGGLVAYAAIGTAESVRLAGRDGPRGVLAMVSVFAVMHLSWAAGFLEACARGGVPVRGMATATLTLVSRLAARLRSMSGSGGATS